MKQLSESEIQSACSSIRYLAGTYARKFDYHEWTDLYSLGMVSIAECIEKWEPKTEKQEFSHFAHTKAKWDMLQMLRQHFGWGNYTSKYDLFIYDDDITENIGVKQSEKEFLHKWLYDLPKKDRWYLYMHYVMGYTMEEIGEMDNIKSSSVCRRIHKSLRSIRARIKIVVSK